ncbi:MAG: aminotransferase class V-fold PLP-dependent enzyme, partial [Eubacterium sp.]|nr:aminotransferase class V-fold PLP-dependent enzyme [Eubacterium sp.]
MFVYADNAATTKISKAALHAMMPAFEEYYGNPSSLHITGQAAAEKLFEARQSIAKNLNAEAREIYFTSGGSEADNQAILTAAVLGKRKGKTPVSNTPLRA